MAAPAVYPSSDQHQLLSGNFHLPSWQLLGLDPMMKATAIAAWMDLVATVAVVSSNPFVIHLPWSLDVALALQACSSPPQPSKTRTHISCSHSSYRESMQLGRQRGHRSLA